MSVQEGATAVRKLQEWEVRVSSSLFSSATDVLNSFGHLNQTNIFEFLWTPQLDQHF